MPYQIERIEYNSNDKVTDTCIIGILYKDPSEANAMIQTYTEAHRSKCTTVIHRVGQSVLVYPNKRVEFTRVNAMIANF